MRVKEESEKASINLNIQKTNIMASSPITSWETDGPTRISGSLSCGAREVRSPCAHEATSRISLGYRPHPEVRREALRAEQGTSLETPSRASKE